MVAVVSLLCSGVYFFMPFKKCENCGNDMRLTRLNYRKRFCSQQCRNESKYGEIVIGDKNNRLIVLKRIENKGRMVECLCTCGGIVEVEFSAFKAGRTKSCGCLRKEMDDSFGGIVTHGLCKTRLYHIWAQVKGRCSNPNNPIYPRYGGRGVKICDEWKDSFESFYKWALENGYHESLDLDKDIRGSGLLYGPNDCTWVTPKENNSRKTNTVWIEYEGDIITVIELAEKLKITRTAVYLRYRKGKYKKATPKK